MQRWLHFLLRKDYNSGQAPFGNSKPAAGYHAIFEELPGESGIFSSIRLADGGK